MGTTLPESVLAVSRAGSGVNHIPCREYADKGIVVMNTPGANAAAVAEAAIAAMLILSRRVYEATQWVRTQDNNNDISLLAEKNKNKFKGKELAGQRLGLIGLGATGQALAKFADTFGMEVWGYKPFATAEFRATLPPYIRLSDSLDELLNNSDFISLHAPSNKSTHGIVCDHAIAKMKPGVFIINFARANLVDNRAILDGIKAGRVAGYFTDFPANEFQGVDRIISTPHLGGRTSQSSDNCAVMAVQQLKDYLETGSISNAIIFPSVKLSADFCCRVCVLHKMNSVIVDTICDEVKKDGSDLIYTICAQKGEYGYTVIDTGKAILSDSAKNISQISGVLRIRTLLQPITANNSDVADDEGEDNQ
jgi:D-3-phosphoglycerate dehydrogenase